LRVLELRRVPVTLAGEADVNVCHRTGARPRLSTHGVRSGGDGRAGKRIGDAGAHAYQGDGFVRSIRPLVYVMAGLELADVRLRRDIDPFQPFHRRDAVPAGHDEPK